MWTRNVMLAALLLAACGEQRWPAAPPARAKVDVEFSPNAGEAWEKTRILPPRLVHRPLLDIQKDFPSGHLPVPRGAVLRFTLHVSSSGAVEDIRVEDWAGVASEKFRARLLDHFRSWRFSPARDESGRAVRAEFPLTVKFRN